MAAAWCLPKSLTNSFLEAIRSGELAPERLMDMTSAERRDAFAKILGDDNAREVNAQFEAKLLLKDQKAGLVNWAMKLGGLTEPVRRDILATINRLDKVLQPDEERAFLADLAAKRLGVTVTADEARNIFEFSQTAERLRQAIAQAGNGDYAKGYYALGDQAARDAGIKYGLALQNVLDYVNSLKPGLESLPFRDRLMHAFGNVWSLPQTLLTNFLHFSALGVQLWGMASRAETWQGFHQQFHYFASEDAFRELNAYIVSHPRYPFVADGGLRLGKITDKLSAREEQIRSHLMEDVNQWVVDKVGTGPNVFRASSRAFTGYINFVRFNVYTKLLDAAEAAGEDMRLGSRNVKDIANAVNDFTGSGNIGIGDKHVGAVPLLNNILFAPRKISATINMFNPTRYLNPSISRTARIASMRQLVGSLVATGTVLYLAKACGAQVSLDPRDQKFMKIQMGDEDLDVSGGNATYGRLLARIATGQRIGANGQVADLGGNRFGAPTRATEFGKWMWGKLAPISGFMVDAMVGKDQIGRPFSMKQEAADKMTPIFIHSAMDFWLNDADHSAHLLPALTSMFGIGLESPLPPDTRSGRNVWGEPANDWGTPVSFRNDPVNQALKEVGYTPNFPMQTIRKVPLTSAQYDDYVRLSGRLAHMRLTDVVSTQGWDAIPAPQRTKVVQSIVRKSRDMAATTIMLQSQGGANDIIAKATQAKIASMGGVAP